MYIKLYKKPQYFKTWLIRILINKCNDVIKANKRVILLENYTENGYYESINKQLEVSSCLELILSPRF